MVRHINILYGIPSPFDFPVVERFQPFINCDKIIPKYFEEVDAYEIIRWFFRTHGEYSHLAFGCSDIIVKPEHLKQLEDDLRENDYPVLTGIMNIALEAINVYNVTSNPIEPSNPAFMWYTDKETLGEPIKQVQFSGFPLMCLRRDIVERFDFEGLHDYLARHGNDNPALVNGSLDTVLCWKFYQEKIPIMADMRIKMLHLKQLINKSEKPLTGTKPPRVLFWPKRQEKPNEIRYSLHNTQRC